MHYRSLKENQTTGEPSVVWFTVYVVKLSISCECIIVYIGWMGNAMSCDGPSVTICVSGTLLS